MRLPIETRRGGTILICKSLFAAFVAVKLMVELPFGTYEF